ELAEQLDLLRRAKREIGLGELGRAVARADLAAATLQAGAHLRGDALVVLGRDPGRHVAPDRRDAAEGAVEQTDRRNGVAHGRLPEGSCKEYRRAIGAA